MTRLSKWVVAACSLAAASVYAADPAVVVTEEQGPSRVTQAFPISVQLQGGVEGYSGSLASIISPGGTYGASIGIEPWQFLGLELGYSGGVANLRTSSPFAIVSGNGPDLIRNGGYAVVTPGVTAWLDGTGMKTIKPYLLGGIGVDGFTAQHNAPGSGFSNQVDGSIPFGAGLELRDHQFVMNARFNYDYTFGDQFSPYASNPLRYQGQLAMGAAF